MTVLTIRTEEWPHGIRCMDCDRELRDGDIYSERLTDLTPDGVPIVELVCSDCALPAQEERTP